MKLAAILFISLTVIGGCSKDIPNNPPDRTATHYTKDAVDPSNNSNPNDSVGELHNEYLDEFLDWYLAAPEEPDSNLIVNYFDTIVTVPSPYIKLSTCLSFIDTDTSDYYGDVVILLDSFRLALEFYLDMDDMVTNESLDLEEKISAIINHEDTVTREGMSTEEILLIDCVASVARYSLVYWTPENEGGLCDLERFTFGNPIENFPWGGILRTDIWGALSTALFVATAPMALGAGLIGSGAHAITAAYDEYLH